MSVIDIDAIVRDAIAADRKQMRDDFRAVIREELERQATDRLMDTAQLAEHLGITSKALRSRLERGSALAGVAMLMDGRRVWRRHDVDALLAHKAQRLRAVRDDR